MALAPNTFSHTEKCRICRAARHVDTSLFQRDFSRFAHVHAARAARAGAATGAVQIARDLSVPRPWLACVTVLCRTEIGAAVGRASECPPRGASPGSSVMSGDVSGKLAVPRSRQILHFLVWEKVLGAKAIYQHYLDISIT